MNGAVKVQTDFYQQKTKKAKVSFVKSKLAVDDRWVIRGLMALYQKQTAEEQAARQTTEHNKFGFTAYDADFLTGMAKLLNEQRTLSQKQMTVVRSKIVKYAGQLVEIAIHKVE